MSERPATGSTVGRVDRGPNPVLVVAGASRGFTVLLLGGVVQPWVGALLPPLGYVWLVVVAVAAFVWAARAREVRGVTPSDRRRDRVVVGVASALGAYALVLPLVVVAAGAVLWSQLAFTAATAVVVGGATAAVGTARGA